MVILSLFLPFPHTVLSGSTMTPLNPSFTHLPNDIKNIFWLSRSLVWITRRLCTLHSSESYRRGRHASLLGLLLTNPYECKMIPEWWSTCVIQMGFHECRKSWGPLPKGWHWVPFSVYKDLWHLSQPASLGSALPISCSELWAPAVLSYLYNLSLRMS